MEQGDLLRIAVDHLERLAIPYAIVGSWKSSVYGEARFTTDIDIVLDLPASGIVEFCAGFPSTEFYLSEPAVREAVTHRYQFNVLHPSSGNKIDFIIVRVDAWHQEQLRRRRRLEFRFGGTTFHGFAAAPEDVILGKLWYYTEGGSDKHLRDIAGILRVSGPAVDREYVERWARDLGYLDAWKQVLAVADGPDRTPGPGVP